MKEPLAISVDIALTDRDLKQIVELQEKYALGPVSNRRKEVHGLLFAQPNLHLLRSMNASARQIVARAEGKIVAYALALPPEIKLLLPHLLPMFEMLDKLYYKGVLLPETKYYILGEIYVPERYRAHGLFQALIGKQREVFSSEYDVCIAEVRAKNLRSMTAHKKAGFKTIHTFGKEGDEWNILLLDWTEVQQDVQRDSRNDRDRN